MARSNGGLLTGVGSTILILVVAFPVPAIILIVIAGIVYFKFFHKFSFINGDKCYYDGVKALNNKNYNKAIELFNLALSSHNYNVPTDDIHVMRGIAYANVGKDNEALNDFNTAIRMFSFDNPTAFLERGKIYSKRNEFDKALEDYNKAIATNLGTNGDDFFYRGLLYLKMDNKSLAIQDFERALALCQKTNYETYLKCQSLIEDLKNKVIQNSEKTVATSNINNSKKEDLIIDLQTCSYNEILLLNGFNEDKARDFIQKRDSGLMWYNIDSFVQAFNLQPHEMILIMDKINFPERQHTKVSYRKIDI